MRRVAVLALPLVVAVSLMLPSAATAAPTVDVVTKECHAEGTALTATIKASGFAPNSTVGVLVEDASGEIVQHFGGVTNSLGELLVGVGGPSPPLTVTVYQDGGGESVTTTLDCPLLPTEKEDCKHGGFEDFDLTKKECKDIVKGKP
jgi:hypothetical protein